MKIRHTIYNQILYFCPNVPPEVGGIIGASNDVIDAVFFDSGLYQDRMAIYTPNVNRINKVIAQWKKDDIRFLGLFHSHPKFQEVLSSGDIEYIRSIMFSMPENVNELYFPIVIPNSHLISYKAINQNHTILIVDDTIDLVP